MNRWMWLLAGLFACFFLQLLFFAATVVPIYGNTSDIAQYDGEHKVVGRLALSRQDGMFAHAGFLGFCEGRENHINRALQLRAYYSSRCDNFAPYQSQTGAQAMAYSLVDHIGGDYDTFRMLAATALAAALTLLLAWAAREFGWVTALLALACIPLLRWLVLLGDNIAQLFGVTLAILVVMGYVHHRHIAHVGTAAYLLFLVKLLFNGAEYFLLAAVLAFVPLTYYAVARNMHRKDVLSAALRIAAGIVLAGMTAFAVLSIQLTIDASSSDALAYVEDRLLSRTYFPTNNTYLNGEYYYDAMIRSTPDVLMDYLRTDAVRFLDFHLPFWALIVLFLAVTPPAVILARRQGNRKLLALACALWVCFLGPLGWIVLVKGHSAAHWFIDPVVFDLPFSILGFLLVFATIRALARRAPVHGSPAKDSAPASADSAPSSPPAHSLVHDNKL